MATALVPIYGHCTSPSCPLHSGSMRLSSPFYDEKTGPDSSTDSLKARSSQVVFERREEKKNRKDKDPSPPYMAEEEGTF